MRGHRRLRRDYLDEGPFSAVSVLLKFYPNSTLSFDKEERIGVYSPGFLQYKAS